MQSTPSLTFLVLVWFMFRSFKAVVPRAPFVFAVASAFTRRPGPRRR